MLSIIICVPTLVWDTSAKLEGGNRVSTTTILTIHRNSTQKETFSSWLILLLDFVPWLNLLFHSFDLNKSIVLCYLHFEQLTKLI